MGLRNKTQRASDPGALEGRHVVAVCNIERQPGDGPPVQRGTVGVAVDYDFSQGLYYVEFRGIDGVVLATRRELRAATDEEIRRARPSKPAEPAPADEPLFVGDATESPPERGFSPLGAALDDPEDQATTPGIAWQFDNHGREVA